MDLIIKNARIVTMDENINDVATVGIKDGRIAMVGKPNRYDNNFQVVIHGIGDKAMYMDFTSFEKALGDNLNSNP